VIGTVLGLLGFRDSPLKQSTVAGSLEPQDDDKGIDMYTSAHNIPMEDGNQALGLAEGTGLPGSMRTHRSGKTALVSPVPKAPNTMVEKKRSVGRPRKNKNLPVSKPSAYPRKDIPYEISDGDQEEQEEDVHARDPAKKPKLNPRAKTPILPPRTSRANLVSWSSKERTILKPGDNEIGESGNGPVANRIGISTMSNSLSKLEFPTNRDISNVASPEGENYPNERKSEDDEPGEIGLYDDPSPVKIASPLKKVNHSQQRSQSSFQTAPNSRTVNNARITTPDDAPESESESSKSTSSPGSDSTISGPLVAELELVQTMIDHAGQVGHRQMKNGDCVFDNEAKKLAEKMHSSEGKDLIRKLNALAGHYIALRASTGETTMQVQDQVTYSVRGVKGAIDKILSNRLGTPGSYFEQKPTGDMLTDIYFNLLSEYLQVVKLAVKARNDQESVTDANIHEIIDLLDLLFDLLNTALDQPKELQPESLRHKPSFQLKKPVCNV